MEINFHFLHKVLDFGQLTIHIITTRCMLTCSIRNKKKRTFVARLFCFARHCLESIILATGQLIYRHEHSYAAFVGRSICLILFRSVQLIKEYKSFKNSMMRLQ